MDQERQVHAMLSHEELLSAIPYRVQSVHVDGWGPKQSGKVRDMYAREDVRALIATDRVSAFDVVLGAIPYKGQVLNQLSQWWFGHVQDIVANHMLDVPDPNVMIVREADVLPVEIIVRGYITGVTSTSLWTLYAAGERKPYGIELPDGLQKNDKLPAPIITPTTKATGGAHDERLTRDEIIGRGIVEQSLYERVEAAAIAIFTRGQEVAEKAGLILVDTKYEFGLIDGQLVVVDEIHTPDSSRYWVLDTYGQEAEPENFDKEYLRKWFVAQGYKGDGEAPVMPEDFVAQVAARYISAYERLTGQTFQPGPQPATERIANVLQNYQLPS